MSENNLELRRARILARLLLVVVAVYFLRLFQLQVLQHETWRRIAREQSLLSVYQKPSRGKILDRNGLPLAVTLPLAYAVGYRPNYVLDRNALAQLIAPRLGKSERELRDRLDSPGFVYLARRVDWQVKLELEALQLGCLQFDPEPRRSYPAGRIAAAVLGFTDVDGNGIEGIEAYLDDELSGAGYRELCRVDAFRKTVTLLSAAPAEYHGGTVFLTLDLPLQTIVEEKLRTGLEGRSYERACAILVEPCSGDILALATQPGFDANAPGEAEAKDRRCWPITDVIEPGSTLKIVPVAEALESRMLEPASRIHCENGRWKVPGAVIHDTHPYRELSVEDVIAFSSNIGAAKIARLLPAADFFDKLRAFGFGSPTMVDLAGEQAGLVPPPARWTGPTCATLAFGQGISCTPLQLVMAYAALANDGVLMKPRLVQYVQFPSGARREYPPERVRRVVPENVARDLTLMLERVVERGTGKNVRLDGLRIAGKTGTAQKVDTLRKTYFRNRYVSSFVGFFPAEDPRFALLVLVDDPRGEYYGAAVAGPIFKNIAAELRDSQLPPLPHPDGARDRWNYRKPGASSLETARNSQAVPSVFATIALHERASAGDTAWVIVPDVKGWPLREAVQELSRHKLSLKLWGNRTVIAQNPPAGTRVPEGTMCELIGATGAGREP